ncbi:MAG: MFS transporter [Acidobacteria bacterium]|nr:MFS transporter [Acidobacteriota bacterium]
MPSLQNSDAEFIARPKHAVLGLVTIFCTYFASIYFFRGAAVTAPKIAADLDGMALFSWAISLPALAAAIATLVFGKLSDMYGRRRLLLTAIVLYLAGAVMSGFSRDYIFFIVASVILSSGQAALTPLCFSVIGDLYAPTERSRWSGLLQIPAGIAALTIPTLVGMMTDSLSWRYFFWISVVMAMTSGILVFLGIPSVSKKSDRKFDLPGSLLLAVAAGTMIIGFSWAGSEYPWTSVRIIGLFAASLSLWTIFLWFENRREEPMLDPQIFRNRRFLTAALAGFISYFGFLGILRYYPLFLQGVQSTSATLSGKIITPFGILMAFIGVPTGYVLARTKRYKWMYIVGYGILTCAVFAMVPFDAGTPAWLGVLVTSLAGFGLGSIPTMNTLVAQFSVPKRLLGVAVGAMFFFVFMGGAIGPAILGSAMNASYERALQSRLPAELNRIADEATLASLVDSRVLLSREAMTALERAMDPAGEQARELFEKTVQALRDSLKISLRTVFLINAICVLVAFLLILTIPEVPIDVETPDKRHKA